MKKAISGMRSSHYLHAEQQSRIGAWKRQWVWRSELPTWCVLIAIYAGWALVVYHWQLLGKWFGTPLLVLLTCWYMSLQHELIHGHPTRWPRVNQLLGLMPLAVWYPYGIYRDSHLAHHRDASLTHPLEDPESYYFSESRWKNSSAIWRRVIWLRNTFFGRMIIGPALGIGALAKGELRGIMQGESKKIAMWLIHLSLLGLILWILQLAGMSAWWYLLAISYPALGLAMVRSFYEHRAVDDPSARSIINEAAWPWRLLFLNLNYHIVHHDLPSLPWYGLRKAYLAYRMEYRQRNQGFVVQGYSQWWRQYAWRSVNVTQHPLMALTHDESPEHLGSGDRNNNDEEPLWQEIYLWDARFWHLWR
ncbi:fatty acid desaturase [Hafnia paralvei]|uniref:fatty acid desaturase n=1 Tax=Hafnia paralvei TaxID=546367 RepID=UPI003C2B444F